jgi:hypothetical protein
MGKYFEEKDIAMIEHEVIRESDILEWVPEHLQWYLAGAHDIAERIIQTINEKEGDV